MTEDIEIEFQGLENLPVMISPIAMSKIKELIKEEVEGAQDAFILYLCISQWNTMRIDWDHVIVTEELGFSQEYSDMLIDFLMELEFLIPRPE